MFQLINIADLQKLNGKGSVNNHHFHISRLEESGDWAVIPEPDNHKHKLYAVRFDRTDNPFLLFKSMYQPGAWAADPQYAQKGWQVIFTEDYLRNNQRLARDIMDFPFLQVPRAIPLRIESTDIAETEGLFHQIALATESSDMIKQVKGMHDLLLTVKRLFNKYSRQQPELQLQVKQADKSLYIRFKDLLEKLNFKSPQEEFRHLAYYAETLDVSSHSLNTAVKRFSGANALHMIQERSLAEAKNLLRTTHLSVKEIAYKMAFRDPAQFGVFFKKHTGITPAQYRDNLRRWS